MKVVLLTPCPPDCVAFGPRQLASLLRAHDHDCSVVFLRGSVGLHRFDASYIYRYDSGLIDDIVALCRGADLVGVSFLSLYYDRAVQLTQALQDRLGVKVIWGGTHPTLRPEQSIHIADRVCVGEGEHALLELLRRLARGEDATDIPGIWTREGAQITRTGEAREVADLDTLPWPDMGTEGHWVDHHGRLVPMSSERMYELLPRLPGFDGSQQIGLRFMATRGCPHRCSYCASSAQNTMRRRSVASTLDHLAWLRARYPFVESLFEFDDTFFATPRRWLQDFAAGYRARIALPWQCQTSPSTLSAARLEPLVDAGLIFCELGLQSGADDTRALFGRGESEAQVRRAADLLHRMWAQGRMIPPRYHVITDVPWESEASVRQTVALLLSLPRPFTLAVGSLCLFPGTELNRRAWREGLLHDELTEVYRKPFLQPEPHLLNWLVRAAGTSWLPRPVVRQLARLPGDARRVTPASRALHQLLSHTDQLPRAARALRHGDLERIRLRLEAPQ